ncbi:hypothetical protein ACHHYP_20257 [Achlya hypogyna]|uniref:Uncharacterized protein n=1 Tax=Achlya hypogyna TaxID=1202772 RepID=A0A1V9YUM0_ACHHY|nr:hypothetical protein ACHHYP_20257 [Achlya hypogyna]
MDARPPSSRPAPRSMDWIDKEVEERSSTSLPPPRVLSPKADPSAGIARKRMVPRGYPGEEGTSYDVVSTPATRSSSDEYLLPPKSLPRSNLVEELTAKYMSDRTPSTQPTDASPSASTEPAASYIATIQPSSITEVAAADQVVKALIQDGYRAIDDVKDAHQVLFHMEPKQLRFDPILAERAAKAIETAAHTLERARNHFRDYCALAAKEDDHSPQKAATVSRNSMFADFDKKMNEIRMSLSAIAAREPYAAPKPEMPSFQQPSPNPRGSFEEYLKEFKRDLQHDKPYTRQNESSHMDKLRFTVDTP